MIKEEILETIHNIYTSNLYCIDDMCESEERGYNCDDCLYRAIAEMIKEND